MKTIKFPMRYLPKNLTKKDKKTQIKMLMKSKKLYKTNKYFTRQKVLSYKNKKSKHLLNALKIYNISNVTFNSLYKIKFLDVSGCQGTNPSLVFLLKRLEHLITLKYRGISYGNDALRNVTLKYLYSGSGPPKTIQEMLDLGINIRD